MNVFDLLKKALNGLGWVSILSSSQLIANLLLTMLLARILTPAEFGGYAFCLMIVSFLQVFAQLGTSAAAIQIEDVDDRFFATGFSIVLVASLLVMLLSLLGGFVLLNVLPSSEIDIENNLLPLLVLIVSLPFFSVAEFYQALFNRDLVFHKPALINFASFVLGFAVVSTILATFGFGVYSLVVAFLIQQCLRFILLFCYLKKRPGFCIWGADARRILRYGVGFMIAKIGNVVALQVDNLIVASALGNAALGLYSRSYQIIMSPINIITMVVDRVLFPIMARSQNDLGRLRNAFLILNGSIFAIFLPLSLLLYEYRHEFVLILLGSNWSAAAAPFGFLGIALAFRAGYRLSDIVARAIGYVYKRAVVQWIYAGCIVFGGLFGTHWGLAGIALGISAAVAFNWLLMTALTMKSLEIDLAGILRSLRPSLFTAGLTYLVIAGLNMKLMRPAPISSTGSTGLDQLIFVAALLLVALTFRFARAAQLEWVAIFRRVRGGE